MTKKNHYSKDSNEYYSNGHTDKCEDSKKEVETEDSKGYLDVDLGTFEAAKIPLFLVIFGIAGGSLSAVNSARHPMSLKLPLLNSYPEMIGIILIYIFGSVVWGPQYMKNRKPIKMKNIIITYNALQVTVCSYVFYQFCVGGWLTKYNWLCQPVIRNDPDEDKISYAVYLYFLTKILDFFDTFFFIVNKKWSHISVLHIVHHSNMYCCCWFGMRSVASGHLTFLGFVNSAMHILVYGYYLLATLGPKVKPYLWWKKYLTTIQMIQFIAVFVHSLQALLSGCDIHVGMARMINLYTAIFFVLFWDFYRKSYSAPAKKDKKKELHGNKHLAENGTSNSNGLTTCSPSVNSEVTHVKPPMSPLSRRFSFKNII